MKLLMVGANWFPDRAGGLNRYFFDMVHAANRIGMSGTALVLQTEKVYCSPFPLRPLTDDRLSIIRQYRESQRAGKNALRESPDLVNAHFAKFVYPWLSSIPQSVPLVVNFQGPWAAEMAEERSGWKSRIASALARHLELRVYQRATRVITLSDAFARIAQEDYGVSADRISVVPGAIDATPFLAAPSRAESRRKLGWPENRPILFTVRRLARRMGLENLISAMQVIRRAHPEVLLLIGGTGSLASELDHRIETLDLKGHCRLLGFVPDEDLPSAYAAADLMVVPTVALEGFGLVTVEAWASGTPVLGTSVGGTREILDRLDPRLLFASPEPAAIAAKVGEALSGRLPLPDQRACREFALQYDWSSVMPRICSVFKQAQVDAAGNCVRS